MDSTVGCHVRYSHNPRFFCNLIFSGVLASWWEKKVDDVFQQHKIMILMQSKHLWSQYLNPYNLTKYFLMLKNLCVKKVLKFYELFHSIFSKVELNNTNKFQMIQNILRNSRVIRNQMRLHKSFNHIETHLPLDF